MKRTFFSLFLTLTAIATLAQPDFKLYFANNVGSVTSLRNLTSNNSQLDWTLISGGSATSGNKNDVEKVIKMFKETRQKTRADQQLFWKMRDDNLLCFRIEDGSGKHGVYEARVKSSTHSHQLNVSSYFFVNTDHVTDSIQVLVNKIGCGPNDTLRFKYYVYDWNDDNLLLFKLDSRRQRSGLTYQLEYVMQAADNEKKISTGYRSLSGKSFQSFYIPGDSILTDVFFVSNGQRLRIDQKLLRKGVNLSRKLNALWLNTNFTLDKHENRELTIFNMLGSGLFEKFDTLYLKVTGDAGTITPTSFDPKTKLPTGFAFNIAEVDGDGKYVQSDVKMEYAGYDAKGGYHKILTWGKPCYIEVFAPDHFPAVFKYPGAIDPKTKILNKDRTKGTLRLLKGKITEKGPDVASQTIYVLQKKDGSTKDVDDKNYQIFTVEEKDLAVMPSSSSQTFIEDGGYQDPKMLDGKAIDKYAELGIAYSVAKNASAGSITPTLTLEEKGTSTQHSVTKTTSSVLDGKDYPPFARSYYTQRWNLVGAISKTETEYKPRLTFGTQQTPYNGIRYLLRREIDYNATKKKGEEEAQKHIFNKNASFETNMDTGKNTSFSFLGKFANVDVNVTRFPGLNIKVLPNFDVLKGIFEVDVFASYAHGRNKVNEDGSLPSSNSKKWLDKMKENDNLRRFKIKECQNGNQWGANITNQSSSATLDAKHWAQHELDDIFKVETNKLGGGPFVDMHFGAGMDFSEKNQASLFYVKALEFKGGYGWFIANRWDIGSILLENDSWKPIYEKLPFKVVGYVNLVAQIRAALGLKTYNFKKDGITIKRRLGLYAELMAEGKAGAGMELKLNFGDPDNTGDPDDPDNSDRARAYCTRFFYAAGGVRGGAKVRATGGLVDLFPTTEEPNRFDAGISLVAIAALEGYADIRLGPLLRFNPRITGDLALTWAYPDNDRNPAIPFYPNYQPTVKKAPKWWRAATVTPPTFPIGTCIMDNLSLRARPFYLGEDHFIVTNGSATGSLNDNRLVEYEVPTVDSGSPAVTPTGTPVSAEGRLAQHHHTVKAGDVELAVYEEMTRPLDESQVAASGLADIDKELQQTRYMRIGSSLRAGGESGWAQYNVAYDENLIDSDPVAALNTLTDDEDNSRIGLLGDAVCVWKRGNYVLPPYGKEGATEQELQEAKTQVEASGLRAFEGDLMLSLFNGEQWGAPESVLKLSKEDHLADYQVVMCNDTALIALTVLPKDKDLLELRYYCKPQGEPVRLMRTDPLNPVKFSLEMVGGAPTIAILHQEDGANCDIFVQQLNLKGSYTGYGTALAVSRHNPQSVMIAVDKENDKPEDFAVVWQCADNSIYRDGKVTQTDSTQIMLNCTRMYMRDNLTSTPHITLGCTADSTYISGYDVYLDDTQVKVLYALTDERDSKTYLLQDEAQFYEDFQYAIGYSQESMIDSDEMSVNLTINNTGSTPITSVDGYINDQQFWIDDIFIEPFSTQTLVVDYELPENFNGLLRAHDVTAVFKDEWAIKKVSRRRGAPALVRRAASRSVSDYASGFSNLHCELVSQTIKGTENKVLLELTDDDVLNESETVHVGLYPSHTDDVPITSSAEVLLKASDFTVVGDQRKAYVELTVDGLEEEQTVEIRARVYNDRILEALDDDDDITEAVVDNLAWQDNQQMITLLPSELDDVTGIPVVIKDQKERKVKVEQVEDGVWLSGLEDGDFVRIFGAGGQTVYQHSRPSSRLFVPLHERGVYLLSTGQEIVKFSF